MIKNVYWSSCKAPLFLPDFSETFIFSTDFQIRSQILDFMKICPVGAALFHADGQIDGRKDTHNEADSLFSQFYESP